MLTKVFAIIVCFQLVSGWVTYEGYKVYKVNAKTTREVELLHNLHLNPKYDFWSAPRMLNALSTVMVAPEEQKTFEETIMNFNLSMSVFIENYGDVNKKPVHKLRAVPSGDVSFDEYMTTDEIEAYISSLPEKYPQNAIIEDLGTSFEGRELYAVRVTTGPVNCGKPTIFIDAGIHAREWVAPSTALYVIQQLVENSFNAELFQDIDWVILPLLNPDGYNYSRTTNSMWRKTRSVTGNRICRGVDGNRNFDYFWMEIGASDNPCTDIYAGPQPNSESETQALVTYLQEHKGEIKLYLTLHSYGQYLLYPWGYTTHPVSNDEELYNLGIAVADSIRSYAGTSYTVGSSARVLYSAAGGSDDYALGAAGVDLSYTVELPAGRSGSGFHPAEKDIFPIVQETWEGIKEFAVYVQNKYVI